MNDREQNEFEAELKRLRPAQPPTDFLGRLGDALRAEMVISQEPVQPVSAEQPGGQESAKGRQAAGLAQTWWRQFRRPRLAAGGGGLAGLSRWLVPAAALAVTFTVMWHFREPHHNARLAATPGGTGNAVKANDVQFQQDLVSTFDAVTPLPSGEPVRFRCREWMEQVVLEDSARGVVIERRIPRLELVSVSFDTY